MGGGDGSCSSFCVTCSWVLRGYELLQKAWAAALLLLIAEMVADLNGELLIQKLNAIPRANLMVLPYFLPAKPGL